MKSQGAVTMDMVVVIDELLAPVSSGFDSVEVTRPGRSQYSVDLGLCDWAQDTWGVWHQAWLSLPRVGSVRRSDHLPSER
jgi:hypothetical protein